MAGLADDLPAAGMPVNMHRPVGGALVVDADDQHAGLLFGEPAALDLDELPGSRLRVVAVLPVEAFEVLQGGTVAPVVVHAELDAALLHCPLNAVGLVHTHSHRLLAEDVLAGGSGFGHHPLVLGVRHGEDHQVHVLSREDLRRFRGQLSFRGKHLRGSLTLSRRAAAQPSKFNQIAAGAVR